MRKNILTLSLFLIIIGNSLVLGQYYFPIEPCISLGIMNTMHPEKFVNNYKVGISGDISVRWRISSYIALSGELFYGRSSPDHKGIIKSYRTFIFSPPYSPDNIIFEKGGTTSITSLYPYIFITFNPQSKIKFNISGGYGYCRVKMNGMYFMGELIEELWKTTIRFSSYVIYKPGMNVGILISYPISKGLNFHFKTLYHIIYTDDESLHFISAVLGISTFMIFPFF